MNRKKSKLNYNPTLIIKVSISEIIPFKEEFKNHISEYSLKFIGTNNNKFNIYNLSYILKNSIEIIPLKSPLLTYITIYLIKSGKFISKGILFLNKNINKQIVLFKNINLKFIFLLSVIDYTKTINKSNSNYNKIIINKKIKKNKSPSNNNPNIVQTNQSEELKGINNNSNNNYTNRKNKENIYFRNIGNYHNINNKNNIKSGKGNKNNKHNNSCEFEIYPNFNMLNSKNENEYYKKINRGKNNKGFDKNNTWINNTKLLLKKVNRYLYRFNNSSNSNNKLKINLSAKNIEYSNKYNIYKSLTNAKFKKRQMHTSFKDLNIENKKRFLNEIDFKNNSLNIDKDKDKDSFKTLNVNSLTKNLIDKKFLSLNKVSKSYSGKKIILDKDNSNELKQNLLEEMKDNNKDKDIPLLLNQKNEEDNKNNKIIFTERIRVDKSNNIKIIPNQKNEDYKNNFLFFNNRYNSDDSLNTLNNNINNDRDNNILFMNQKSVLNKEELYNDKIYINKNKIYNNQIIPNSNNNININNPHSKSIEKIINQINFLKNSNINNYNSNNIINDNNIDENFLFENFYKLKNEISLTYTNDYIKDIRDELLKLEIDLFLERIIEFINEYHCIINDQNIIYKEYLYMNKFYKNLFFIFCKLYKRIIILKEKKNNDLNIIQKDYKISNRNNISISKNEINIFQTLFKNNKKVYHNNYQSQQKSNIMIKMLKNILIKILNKKNNKEIVLNNKIYKNWINNNISKEIEFNDNYYNNNNNVVKRKNIKIKYKIE